MTFDEFLKQCWQDHGTQAEQVAARLDAGVPLLEKGDQVASFAHLVTHVMGEHLGTWEAGIRLLQRLQELSISVAGSEAAQAVARSIAGLQVASGNRGILPDFALSDQIRALTIAASTLIGRNDSARAGELFRHAVTLANGHLGPTDPANRALAVAGNNMACSLEEKTHRSASEVDLMVLAAKTGRKYWEIAGTWMETERAEYRLAQTYLKANDAEEARIHAECCLKLATQNNAPALELFFGYEALALVEKSRNNPTGFSEALRQMNCYFENLDAKDKTWCRPTIQKLTDVN